MALLFSALWEAWWNTRPELRDVPALVFLGNDLERMDWMARRVKFVDYEVHFVKNEDNEKLLGAIFTEPNEIYCYFTRQYISEQADETKNGTVSLDALHTARSTIRSLYAIAGLGEPPKYFLDRPVEEEHDIGRDRWIQAIGHGQIEVTGPGTEANPWFADFKPGMEKQIDEYRGFLVGVKNRREGSKLVLEVPDTFRRWIGRGDERAGTAKLLEAAEKFRKQERLRTKQRGFWNRFSRSRGDGT